MIISENLCYIGVEDLLSAYKCKNDVNSAYR